MSESLGKKLTTASGSCVNKALDGSARKVAARFLLSKVPIWINTIKTFSCSIDVIVDVYTVRVFGFGRHRVKHHKEIPIMILIRWMLTRWMPV